MNLKKELSNALTLRPLRKYLDHKRRRTVFYDAFSRFRENPGAGVADHTLLRKLIYGWDNESWSAWTEYLSACLKACEDVDGPVLECGSGLSSLLMGVVLQDRGGHLHSLEHHPEWALRQRRFLDRFDIRSVTVHDSPIKPYGDYDWYGPAMDQLPSGFAMVICDGPPGVTKGGRFGMLPVMRDRLASGCRIFVDDAARPDERSMLDRWSQSEGREYSIYGDEKPYGVLQLA
ncbi:MAG: class I SAM-dependent methyltransferase [Calditrichaeota bacterium]|nr:class I SAM-dependent methyltransferase [Candidatus Cloacimonadota bacterium]MCB1046265.1 class I SAM-dependent methyltransferase [Calditrichota bacterium]MCB9474351.1 class I SAM-dependent methyltransferase [Candidatus Delongbacteria bacterium]